MPKCRRVADVADDWMLYDWCVGVDSIGPISRNQLWHLDLDSLIYRDSVWNQHEISMKSAWNQYEISKIYGESMKMSLIPLEIEIDWIPLEITEISPVDLAPGRSRSKMGERHSQARRLGDEGSVDLCMFYHVLTWFNNCSSFLFCDFPSGCGSLFSWLQNLGPKTTKLRDSKSQIRLLGEWKRPQFQR